MPNPNLPGGPMGIFIPAIDGAWSFIGGTWTKTRSAAGIYFMRKTAGAATTTAVLNIMQALERIVGAVRNAPMGSELKTGLLTDFDLVYAIGTANLTSLTPTFDETVFADGATPAVSNPSAVSPTTATNTLQADTTKPYVKSFSVSSPFIIGKNAPDYGEFFELSVVDPGTSVFDLYGIQLKMGTRV